jgi:hypothetical protein
MTVEETLRAYDLYDAEIGPHGFLPTMRDYRLVVERLDEAPVGVFHYDFLGCAEARYEVTLPPEAFSMDDRLLHSRTAAAPDAPAGFVWAVASACSAEEGVTYSATSERARHWAARLGRPMHEVVIGTNVFRFALVFHDLRVRPGAAGAVPGPPGRDV